MDAYNGEWVAAHKQLLGDSLLEIGAYIVEGQEKIALRNYVQSFVKEYIGLDMRNGPGVDVVSDAISIPFPDNRFDSVVSLDTLEHCKYPHKIFQECFRVTKVGGYLLLATVFIFPIHDYPGDYFRYSHEALRFMAEDAGYNVIECPKDKNLSNPGVVKIIAQRI